MPLSRFPLLVLALVVAGAASGASAPQGRGFVLAGEIVRFDAGLLPVFTERQLRTTAQATREGFVRWADTTEGRAIIRRLRAADREVVVTESAAEPGVGRAPQPGFLTLLAADDPRTLKTYELILNPVRAAEYGGKPSVDLGFPLTPADAMAVAWAAEMLHIDFYARGIPLPHHRRSDFQERWARVAGQLGMPQVRHETDQTERPERR